MLYYFVFAISYGRCYRVAEYAQIVINCDSLQLK